MRRTLSILISLLILAVIYWKIDTQALIEIFRQCNLGWLIISLAMVVPLTLLTAVRLQYLVPGETDISLGESNRLILAACTLNMILPSKMGDIVKAYFIKEQGHLDGSLSLSLVVFEKACDMLALLLWCGFGLLLYPQKDWLFWLMTVGIVGGFSLGLLLIGSRAFVQTGLHLASRVLLWRRRHTTPAMQATQVAKLQTAWDVMHEYFWRTPRRLATVSGLSVFVWFLHLVQIWLFILALNAEIPFLANLALAPLALLAGLLPFTFAGVGTRDAALILFYAPYFNEATAAALGILCTSRYLMPAVGGLPFLGQYLTVARGLGQRKRF